MNPVPPILILGYSRPEKVQNLIKTCVELGSKNIYLAIDGQKGKNLLIRDQFDSILATYGSANEVRLKVWHRDSNLGTPVSMITAIDWFFKQEPAGIILEDDIEITQEFLKFVDTALRQFEKDEEVWCVSGCQFVMSQEPNSYSWCHYPLIWGWATWREKWRTIRSEILEIPMGFKRDSSMTLNGYWNLGFNRSTGGKVESWAIPFAAKMWLLDKYCVLPPVNLTRNNGNDSVATHTKGDIWPLNLKIERLATESLLSNVGRGHIARFVDAELESSLFRVRKRQVISFAYFRIKSLFRKKGRNDLNLRVRRVIIP
jgi:hypothetical protein